MERDTKYSAGIRAAARSRADRVGTTAATLVRSVKAECTGRMVFFGRSLLEVALMHYVALYHEERNHQRLQNRLQKCSETIRCVARTLQ